MSGDSDKALAVGARDVAMIGCAGLVFGIVFFGFGFAMFWAFSAVVQP